ncbi:uncharacterized protein LOC144424273 [Styela clava]
MGEAADVGILKQGIDLKNKRSILLSSLKDQIRPGWFQSMFKGRKAVRREDLLELMHALDECGDAADEIIKSSIHEIRFSYMPLTPSDKFTLASVLGRCSYLDDLEMVGVPLTSSDLKLLASSMQSSNIQNDSPLPHDKAVIFCDILPHITEEMRLYYRVEPEDIKMIDRELDSKPDAKHDIGTCVGIQ